jgi:hypothetical protein
MDHKSAYAHHIAQAIRHKKAMSGPEEKTEEVMDIDMGDEEIYEEDKPLDPKAARKERIKAILAR